MTRKTFTGMDDKNYAISEQPEKPFQLAEIQVSYHPQIKPSERPQIRSSEDAFKALLQIWPKETINYQESLYVLVLDRANRILGFHLHSIGHQAACIVHVGQVLAVVLKSNGTSFLVSHNHPSQNISPSQADRDITHKLKKGAELLDVQFMDHLIICEETYYSFADEGELQ
ncbi:MAG: JAB domain-containing protein [Bacteroidota bacterium]